MPDIVATMGTLGLVIAAQIVGGQSDLERARSAKIRIYVRDRSNQHPSPTGDPLLERYLVRSIRIRFSDTGHHHPE